MSLFYLGSQCKIQGNINAKIYFGHNFWLEGPTVLRPTPLSYIFHALFRDTQLEYVQHSQPNIWLAKYPNIWLIWLFGYLATCHKRGHVGYPWKEHEKCSSEALTWSPKDPPVKSYGQKTIFAFIFPCILHCELKNIRTPFSRHFSDPTQKKLNLPKW